MFVYYIVNILKKQVPSGKNIKKKAGQGALYTPPAHLMPNKLQSTGIKKLPKELAKTKVLTLHLRNSLYVLICLKALVSSITEWRIFGMLTCTQISCFIFLSSKCEWRK